MKVTHLPNSYYNITGLQEEVEEWLEMGLNGEDLGTDYSAMAKMGKFGVQGYMEPGRE